MKYILFKTMRSLSKLYKDKKFVNIVLISTKKYKYFATEELLAFSEKHDLYIMLVHHKAVLRGTAINSIMLDDVL